MKQKWKFSVKEIAGKGQMKRDSNKALRTSQPSSNYRERGDSSNWVGECLSECAMGWVVDSCSEIQEQQQV